MSKIRMMLLVLGMLTFRGIRAQVNLITLSPTKDAFVAKKATDSSWENTNYGTHNELMALSGTHGGAVTQYRSFMAFDLSSIPENAVILEAKLFLYSSGDHSQISGSNASMLHKINSSWAESTITWSNQPTYSALSGDPELPASTVSGSNNPNLDYVVDVTAFLSKQQSSGTFEFILKLSNETGYRKMRFWSNNYGTTNKRPKLEIKWTIPYTMAASVPSGFIELEGDYLNIVHLEDVNPTGNLNYRILNPLQEPISSLPTISGLQQGTNYVSMDTSSLSLTSGQFYLLEITNAKGEKQFLRFKKL